MAESVGDAPCSACTSAGDVLDELGTERSFSAEVARGTVDGAEEATNICCTNEEDDCAGASDDGALAGGDAELRFPELSVGLPSTIKAVGNMS